LNIQKVILGTVKDVTETNKIKFINQLKYKIMRTLSNNQLTGTFEHSKSYTWNSKRRYRN